MKLEQILLSIKQLLTVGWDLFLPVTPHISQQKVQLTNVAYFKCFLVFRSVVVVSASLLLQLLFVLLARYSSSSGSHASIVGNKQPSNVYSQRKTHKTVSDAYQHGRQQQDRVRGKGCGK